MILDDEKFIRMGLRKFIEESGIPHKEIVECRNGQHALEALNEYQFDVIFTDIKMPIMDGIEFITRLKEMQYETEVVVLSGYDEFNYAVEAFKGGARDYLLKPIDRETVVKILIQIESELHEKNILNQRKKEEAEKMKEMEKKYKEALTALHFTEQYEKGLMNNELMKEKGLNINPQMEKALHYIQDHYKKKLNMAIVSNYVSLSYTFFSETFKEYVGVNFAAYLKTIRIQKAKELLVGTDKRVAEIAKEVGFEDEKLFMKSFKQITQLSPTEYRKCAQIVNEKHIKNQLQEDLTADQITRKEYIDPFTDERVKKSN